MVNKYHCIVAGLFISLGLVVWGYIVFLRIFFTEKQGMMFYVDRYGEASVEFVVIPIVIGFLVFCLYLVWSLYKDEKGS